MKCIPSSPSLPSPPSPPSLPSLPCPVRSWTDVKCHKEHTERNVEAMQPCVGGEQNIKERDLTSASVSGGVGEEGGGGGRGEGGRGEGEVSYKCQYESVCVLSISPSLPVSLSPCLPLSLSPCLPVSLSPCLPHSLSPSLPLSLTPSLQVVTSSVTRNTRSVMLRQCSRVWEENRTLRDNCFSSKTGTHNILISRRDS